MSVIAKFHCNPGRQVPGGYLISMSAVYDTDLCKPENENRRFTQATPGGDAVFEARSGFRPGEYYLLFDTVAPPLTDNDWSVYAIKVRCRMIEDYGGTSKSIELLACNDQDEILPKHRLGRDKGPPFNLQMTVDNPNAAIWFYPGVEYFLRFYPATAATLDSTLALVAREQKTAAKKGAK